MASSGRISVPFGVVDDHVTHLQNTVQAMTENHAYVHSVVDQLITGGYTGSGSDALGTSTQELKKALDVHTDHLTALKAATAAVAGSGGLFQSQDIASGKRFVLYVPPIARLQQSDLSPGHGSGESCFRARSSEAEGAAFEHASQ